MGPELQESEPQELDPQDSEPQDPAPQDSDPQEDDEDGVRPPRSDRDLVAFSISRRRCPSHTLPTFVQQSPHALLMQACMASAPGLPQGQATWGACPLGRVALFAGGRDGERIRGASA